MTKHQKMLVENYQRATARQLSDVYTTWSAAKERAYNWCINRMVSLNGFSGFICSANTFGFSFAFQYEKDGKLRLQYHTKDHEYDFEVDVEDE